MKGVKKGPTPIRLPKVIFEDAPQRNVAIDAENERCSRCPGVGRRRLRDSGARAAALLESRANFGVLGGIVITLLGGAIVQQSRELLLLGLPVGLGGWALFIWGCGNYMRWKGYSGWFGLFGFLLLPGLVILACFPNRRKRGLSEGAKSIGSAF
jgi:hypothetical protein